MPPTGAGAFQIMLVHRLLLYDVLAQRSPHKVFGAKETRGE
jgi:hypothetical protein